MAKIDSATLEVINDYYNSCIESLEKIQKEIQNKKDHEYRQNFEESEQVKQIRTLFKSLEEKFGTKNLILKCELYAFYNTYDYKKDKKWIEANIEITRLKKEKALLITSLECNPKNSIEYKVAYEKLQKLFK